MSVSANLTDIRPPTGAQNFPNPTPKGGTDTDSVGPSRSSSSYMPSTLGTNRKQSSVSIDSQILDLFFTETTPRSRQSGRQDAIRTKRSRTKPTPDRLSKELSKTQSKLGKLSAKLPRKSTSRKKPSVLARTGPSEDLVDLTSQRYAAHRPQSGARNAGLRQSAQAVGSETEEEEIFQEPSTSATGASTRSAETTTERESTPPFTTPSGPQAARPETTEIPGASGQQQEVPPQASGPEPSGPEPSAPPEPETAPQGPGTAPPGPETGSPNQGAPEMGEMPEFRPGWMRSLKIGERYVHPQGLDQTEQWRKVFEPIRTKLHLHSMGVFLYHPETQQVRLVVGRQNLCMRSPKVAVASAITAFASSAVGLSRWASWNLPEWLSQLESTSRELVTSGLLKLLKPLAFLPTLPYRLLRVAVDPIVIQPSWKVSLVLSAEKPHMLFNWAEALITTQLGNRMGLQTLQQTRNWGRPILIGLLAAVMTYYATRMVNNGVSGVGPFQAKLVSHLRMNAMATGRTAETVHMLKSSAKRWLEEHAKGLDTQLMEELMVQSVVMALMPTPDEMEILNSLEASSPSIWRMYKWNRTGSNGWFSLGLPR